MKSARRSKRRAKTISKKETRAKRLANTRVKNSGWYKRDKNGEFVRITSYAELIDDLKKNHTSKLETPKQCSCSMCSHNNPWRKTSNKRKRKKEMKAALDSFYAETNDDSEIS